MSLWLLLLLLLALLKLPLAALMLWIPFRNDEAMNMKSVMSEAPADSDDEGGSKTLPGAPRDPHPRVPFPHSPRRGPHGADSAPPSSPARVRVPAPVVRGRRVHV